MLVTLILSAMAAGAISYTVTRGSIFQEVREWISSRSKFLGKLTSCPYCFLHWVALLFSAITPLEKVIPEVTGRHWMVDFVTVWFASVAIGATTVAFIALSTLAVKLSSAGSTPQSR